MAQRLTKACFRKQPRKSFQPDEDAGSGPAIVPEASGPIFPQSPALQHTVRRAIKPPLETGVDMSAEGLVSFGVDFGTSNTVVARTGPDGKTETVVLDPMSETAPICPTVLAFEETFDAGMPSLAAIAGSEAIALASEHPDDFRYLQSFKNHIASTDFDATLIFGKRFTFPDLLRSFLVSAGIEAEINAHKGPKTVVIGRPVKFHGEYPDEDLALSRYRDGFSAAGIDNFHFALEPVGGAFSYFRCLTEPAQVLIGDFGGGTSDFVVARFRPGLDGARAELLSHAGVGIAGEAFDHCIVQNALLKHFGVDVTYRSDEKILPVPKHFFSALSRWHDLTRLRLPRHLDTLKDICRKTDTPEKIETLIHIITHNKGLTIARAVSDAKARLSDEHETELVLDTGRTVIRETITRRDFEDWISEDLRRISDAVDTAIETSGLTPATLDGVFLTGGTSFVPAIQSIFTDRFAADRIHVGERFSSVAEGLSLYGLEKVR